MVQYRDDVDHLITNGITAYIRCARCLEECPSYLSAAEFARFAVGYTPYGLQIWCVRHNLNVYHLDLVSTPRPRCITHSLPTETPFHHDLQLGCARCGFTPGVDDPPA